MRNLPASISMKKTAAASRLCHSGLWYMHVLIGILNRHISLLVPRGLRVSVLSVHCRCDTFAILAYRVFWLQKKRKRRETEETLLSS